MKVEKLWIVRNTWLGDCLRSVVDTGNWSGISRESYTRSQNQGVPGQPGAINNEAIGLPDFGSPVKESRERVSIGSETRPDYVQSIYVRGMLIRDRGYVQWKICGSEE